MTLLDQWFSMPGDSCDDLQSGFGVFPQHPLSLEPIRFFQGLFHVLMEWIIESAQHRLPLQITIRYFIKFLLYVSRKFIVHDFLKMFFEKIRYDHTHIGWIKSVFGGPCDFGLLSLYNFIISQGHDRKFPFLAVPAFFGDVPPTGFHDFFNRRSVSRRPSYPLFFEFLYKTGFCITSRWSGKTFFPCHRFQIELLTFPQWREHSTVLLLFVIVVRGLYIKLQKSIKN